MLAMVAGSTSYCFGGSQQQVFWAAAVGACLALAGFYLDSLLDKHKDQTEGKNNNPFATNEMSVKTGYVLVILCIGVCVSIALTIDPAILIPCALVIGIVVGMNRGILDSPVLRALGLGMLQALYVVIGGMFAHGLGYGIILTALFLFFAMTGGRVIGDVRDMPYDLAGSSQTIPVKYGIGFTIVFLWINELIAYSIGIILYLVEDVGRRYLFCIIAIAVCGSIINLFFTAKPEPKVAILANRMSLGLLGSLFVLAMILGRH
jgi:4-hydroxybenzoate polyprenyltransferase